VEVKCEHFGRWWVAFQRSHDVPASTLVHGRRQCSKTRPLQRVRGGIAVTDLDKKFQFPLNATVVNHFANNTLIQL